MNQPFIKAGISACLLSLVLSGCVDNDYDLSNICLLYTSDAADE